MRKLPVIGIPVACTDYAGAVEWILARAQNATTTHAVEAANTHVVTLARYDAEFAQTMERFDLILPDGMPLVWSVNRQLSPETRLRDRVYGPTLMLETLRAATARRGFKHFLLGGSRSTLDKLAARFAAEFPETEISGVYSPPYGNWPMEETGRIIDLIRESGANLIWVGLGCPKQEHWISRNKDRLPPGVYFGIGAAFAFHAGDVRQAPAVLQRSGLEWAFRLAAEPRRLFKRYLVHNSLFLYYTLRTRDTSGPTELKG